MSKQELEEVRKEGETEFEKMFNDIGMLEIAVENCFKNGE